MMEKPALESGRHMGATKSLMSLAVRRSRIKARSFYARTRCVHILTAFKMHYGLFVVRQKLLPALFLEVVQMLVEGRE